MTRSSIPTGAVSSLLARRHLRFGWWSLLCFLSLGIALEALHGFKVRWYLDVANETRRLMWTLAHAHGVLLALVNVGYALTIRILPAGGGDPRWRRIGSPCLIAASVLLPVGFLLGGVYVFDGDAGVGVALVPVGAVLLFASVLLTARRVQRWGGSLHPAGEGENPTRESARKPAGGAGRPGGKRRRSG